MISKKFIAAIRPSEYGGKARSIGKCLHNAFPDRIIDVVYETPSPNIINDDNIRLIYMTQALTFFKKTNLKYYFNGIHFIRDYFIKSGISNKATNGFSYFRTKKGIPKGFDYYICSLLPTMDKNWCDKSYIFNKNLQTEPSNITIGIYEAPYKYSIDSYIDFLQSIPYKFNLTIMGDSSNFDRILESTPNIKGYKIFTDNTDFFNDITIFVYNMSIRFDDPWPTSLEEAIRLNKHIIILQNDRWFIDGIDDLMSCSNYSTSYDLDKVIDNSNNIINKIDWIKYYNDLMDNDFTPLYHSINREVIKYKTFNDYLNKALMQYHI